VKASSMDLGVTLSGRGKGVAKGPHIFGEEEYNSMNSEIYNMYVLTDVEAFIAGHPVCTYMHYSTPSHRPIEPTIDPFGSWWTRCQAVVDENGSQLDTRTKSCTESL
jgi:hypothetical protein